MGARFSTDQSSVLVALERPSYQPGETVQGIVCLNALADIPSTGVYLKVGSHATFAPASTPSRCQSSTARPPVP